MTKYRFFFGQENEIITIMKNNFTLIKLAKVRHLIIPRIADCINQFKPLELLMKVKTDPTLLENNLELSCKVEFM